MHLINHPTFIAQDFKKIVDDYVANKYPRKSGAGADAAE